MSHSELDVIRHSTAHIMACAVIEMFPEAKIAIGPSIDDGFYYDFDLPRALTPEDLAEIEKIMKTLIKQKLKFVRNVVSKQEALEMFKDQPYKVELINDLPEGEEISTYTCGKFTDLCRGPHVESSGMIKANAVKLMSIAGAYWRGDEKRPMLQRIYGTAWNNIAELNDHLKRIEEIKKRDHRVLGKQLELFSMHSEAGAGLVYWHPKGTRIRTIIEDFWRNEHYANGYDLVSTPHIGKSWLWETSGHLGFYNDNMYAPIEIDNEQYYIKPMNCPFHIMIYKSKVYSYRNLPLRWAELGTVYRYERSGVLHGLLRVRGFTQDDAHIICTPSQVESEILEVLRFSLHMWQSFGFSDIKAYLATKPEKSVGEPERWNQALESLRKALIQENIPYEIDEGGGAFYGPKIDLKIRDALGREWQTTTIQFDFNEPERFDMKFFGEDGKDHRPYMIHRALLGSIERFFGILIEHYAGAFPVWLMPTQAMVIPVTTELDEYAHEIEAQLKAAGIRVDADYSKDRLPGKIRNAQMQKIPYLIIIGYDERDQKKVSLRMRKNIQKNMIDFDECLAMIRSAIAEKSIGIVEDSVLEETAQTSAE